MRLRHERPGGCPRSHSSLHCAAGTFLSQRFIKNIFSIQKNRKKSTVFIHHLGFNGCFPSAILALSLFTVCEAFVFSGSFFFLLINLFDLFIFYFWLHWVFVDAWGLLIAVASLVAEHGL